MKHFLIITENGVGLGQSCCIAHMAQKSPLATQIIHIGNGDDLEDHIEGKFMYDFKKGGTSRGKSFLDGIIKSIIENEEKHVEITESINLLVKLIRLKKMKESKNHALISTYAELSIDVWEQAFAWLEENPKYNLPDAILWNM